MKSEKQDESLHTLEEIRDLLILVAAKVGATNAEVAKVLGCGESTLRKKVSFAKSKPGDKK
ncbi:MAG: helix-turn-helix domain-containing protein [Candidatus Woesearchaeota archaeon]